MLLHNGWVRIPGNVPATDDRGTVELWVTPVERTDWFSRRSSTDYRDARVTLYSAYWDNRYHVILADGTVTQTDIVSHAEMAFNVPTHLVFTWDSTTWRIYVNGQLDAQGPQTVRPRTAGTPLWIGQQTVWMPGHTEVDDVAVYAVALGADQIANHHAVGRGGSRVPASDAVIVRVAPNADPAARNGTVTIVGEVNRYAVAVGQESGVVPTVLINNVAAPTPTTVHAGETLAVQLLHHPEASGSWAVLYSREAPDKPDPPDAAWQHVSTTPGGTDYAVSMAMPRVNGDYEVRWFGNDRNVKFATSTTIRVIVPVPTLTVNGVRPPATLSVLPDATITVNVTDEWANVQDFVALMPQAAADTDPVLAYAYLSGNEHPPLVGMTSASFTFTLPHVESGTFDVRLFADNTRTKRAQSSPITISTPSPTLRANGQGYEGTVTAETGTTLTIDVSETFTNRLDWVALMRHDAPDTDPVVAYAYLSGTHSPPDPALASASFTLTLPPGPSSATFDLRLFANDGRARLATGPTIETGTPPGAGPHVSLTSPSPSAVYGAGETIPLAASASDTGPGVSRVDFAVNGTVVTNATSAPWTGAWGTSTNGTYAITAIATDLAGVTATSNAVTITVGGGSSGGSGGPSCTYSVSPLSLLFGAGGASQTVTVTAPAGCVSTIPSFASWLGLTITQDSGTWTTTVTVGPNPSAQTRVAILQLAGTSVVIEQNGVGSSSGASTAGITRIISSTGQTATVALPASSSAPVVDVAWLTAQVDAATGILMYSATAAPLGTAREGHIVWGPSTITIVQPAAVFDPATGRWYDEPSSCGAEFSCGDEWRDYLDVWYYEVHRELPYRPGKVLALTANASTGHITFTLVGDNRIQGAVKVELFTNGGSVTTLNPFASYPRAHDITFAGLGLYNFVKVTWDVPTNVPCPGTTKADEETCAVTAITMPIQPAASVEVRCRLVNGMIPFLFQQLHCYAVTRDSDTGPYTTIEGSEENFQMFGTLHMASKPGWPRDGATVNDPAYFQQYDIVQSVADCLKRVADAINRVRSPYAFFPGPNSNSGIATALQACGLPNSLPFNAPGREYYVSFAPF